MPEIAGADFKSDVQGAELLAFRGAVQTLKDVLVVHTEVIFVPLYKDQPLFGDVDCFLRGVKIHRGPILLGPAAITSLRMGEDVIRRMVKVETGNRSKQHLYSITSSAAIWRSLMSFLGRRTST